MPNYTTITLQEDVSDIAKEVAAARKDGSYAGSEAAFDLRLTNT